MLEIKNVSKQFGQKKILDSVSLDVGRGSIAVLLGASGVGKSTLLRILNGLESYDSGDILLDSQRVDTASVHKHHTVGMVFQNFNLFEHLTVEHNITLALEEVQKMNKKDARTLAHKLLAHYGLEDKAHAYPADLSGGQKQRLALARTLALKPTVICLDEPTSALDPLLTAYVAQTIQDLAKDGYIVLVATHDTTLLERLACSIYLMKQGHIIETASSADLAQHPDKFPALKKFIAGSH